MGGGVKESLANETMLDFHEFTWDALIFEVPLLLACSAK